VLQHPADLMLGHCQPDLLPKILYLFGRWGPGERDSTHNVSPTISLSYGCSFGRMRTGRWDKRFSLRPADACLTKIAQKRVFIWWHKVS